MTIEEFNKKDFSGGMIAEHDNKTWDVIACDFADKEICIESENITKWVHCEDVEILNRKKVKA